MRNHFLHALILFCGNTATEMTNPLASIGAMGYHFGNAVNKEDLRIVGVRSTEQSAGIKVGGFCPRHHIFNANDISEKINHNRLFIEKSPHFR